MRRRFSSAAEKLQRTVLYDFHVQNKGKMVPFAGWEMPVQYSDSIMESTKHCRKGASVFDVSHMGQLKFHGKDRVEFLETVIVGSVQALKPDQTRYSLITNDKGGIIDDTVVTRRDDHIFMVINASRVDVDLAHINEKLEAFTKMGKDVTLERLTDRSLVALQGPKASNVLSGLTDATLEDLKFFFVQNGTVAGVPECIISRSGYTGEDGFEISVPSDKVVSVCEAMIQHEDCILAGLGARDALRLEAGLSLYGNDLDETTTPLEADLKWTMSKKRIAEGQFPGAEIIRAQANDPSTLTRKRVGLLGGKGPVPRGHMLIVDAEGNTVGEVTSGAFSPCLGTPLAMGYIRPDLAVVGTELSVQVRKAKTPVTVSKVPFVVKGYYH